jgi:Zn-dependent metalloprotease
MTPLTRFTLLVSAAAAFAFGQADQASQRAIERGNAHLAQKKGDYGLAGAGYELRARKVNFSGGTSHVRYDEFYKGVRVFEGEAIVHLPQSGEPEITSSLRGNINLDVQPVMTEGQARAAAVRALGIRGASEVTSALEILPKGERSAVDRLVWHLQVFVANDQDGTGKFDLFYDAKTSQLVWSFNSLETASYTGTGFTAFAGQVPLPLDVSSGKYSMISTGQSNLKTNDLNNRQNGSGATFSNGTGIFGNGKPDLTDRSTAGADAHFGMTKTWEYYNTTFGRNGIDGAGKATYGRVHYGRNYENAFWSSSCFCMTYGDGANTFYPLVSIDVTGHEMSHGVMASEANLTYSGESGGLNEANSDIFGTMVEFYINSQSDVPDYWIGERIFKSNWSNGTYTQTRALRYMDDPAKDGRSPACWSSTLGSLDVHYSSGPANHMFYLLAEGGTSKCNGNPVTGIGRAAAAAIWYKAIGDYMTSSTNYAGARTASLNAAKDLYGAGSAQYNAVAAAFAAINVN